MSAPEKHPPAKDAHGAADAAEKPGFVGKLLAPIKSIVGKVGKIGALFGALFGIIPKALRWAKGHKLIAIVALVLILVVGNGAIWFVLSDEGPPPPQPITIQDALKALDLGDYPKAREIAHSLETVDPSDFDTWGGVPFVLAACDLYERESGDAPPTLIEDAQTATLLTTAKERGFPAGREAQGHYLLGRCLAQIGQYADARDILEKALVYGAPAKAIRLPLAEAWSVEPQTDYPRARSYLNDYLGDKSLNDVERQWGMIELARQQLSQGDVAAAQKTLGSFQPGDPVIPAAKLMEGRVALAKARAFAPGADSVDAKAQAEMRKKMFQEAIDQFRQVAPQDRASISWQRLGIYFIGAALSDMGDTDGAVRQFTRLRLQFSNSYEAIVGGLDQAELLRRQGKDEEAIGLMSAVLRELPPEAEIGNPHLPELQPARKVRENYDRYMRAKDFTAAIKMVNAGEPALGSEVTWQLKAEVYEQWAQSLFAESATAPFEERDQIDGEARRHIRQAGQAYQELAAIHFSDRRYPDDLWKSAESFNTGRNYADAVKQYRAYIDFNTPRRRAEALYGLSGALLADGRSDEALEAVNEAIRTYPRNPGVYAARLLASNILVELGEGAKAEEMLVANLEGGQLAPESNEWRDSLFALGTLLYREGRPADALPRLNEAVRRWPDLPQSEDAYYLIAECHRERAEQLRSAAAATSVPSERALQMREVNSNVALALDNYDHVRDQLEQRSDRELLPKIDQATLRNCYFGRAAMLQQLGKLEEALQAYADAANRYQFAPEAIVAYVQSAECLRLLKREEEARVTVEQAKVTLARIPTDADFPATTSRTRQEWQKELDWLSKNL